MYINRRYFYALVAAAGVALLSATASAGRRPAPEPPPEPTPRPSFYWATVVNNNDLMPPLGLRNFNSYNQPSVNVSGLVVIRARSKGGQGLGQPVHGIYTRDMAIGNSQVTRVLDRTTEVPQPNNLGTMFVETPSFPRIDSASGTIATRGNHQPVWEYVVGTDPDTHEDIESRAGTTGIYTNPYGELITGVSKLGAVPEFSFFEVPEFPGITFEVFPGSPAVTLRNTLVFKGNYTAQDLGKTGVYYRTLDSRPGRDGTANTDPVNQLPGGNGPVVMIANNTDTLIPGTSTVFGSTAPPSAAGRQVVFAGFDNEDAPTLGGIYLAPLQYQPRLTTLVGIGQQVPGETPGSTFNGIGEGVAFDGRYVGFWGAWGGEAKTVRLYCAREGNTDRIAYCNRNLVCEGTGETIGDPNSVCDDAGCYQERQVPVNQGIFIHDIETHSTKLVAKTGTEFDEFLFWNYSGKTPCTGGGHSEEGDEDDGEPARWRSSAFVAVSGRAGLKFNTVFKARKGELVGGVFADPVDGIYLRKWVGRGYWRDIETVIDTTMNGQLLDPEAPAGSIITELGLERESLRGDWLAVNASMGSEGGAEEDGMAGVYVTRVR